MIFQTLKVHMEFWGSYCTKRSQFQHCLRASFSGRWVREECTHGAWVRTLAHHKHLMISMSWKSLTVDWYGIVGYTDWFCWLVLFWLVKTITGIAETPTKKWCVNAKIPRFFSYQSLDPRSHNFWPLLRPQKTRLFHPGTTRNGVRSLLNPFKSSSNHWICGAFGLELVQYLAGRWIQFGIRGVKNNASPVKLAHGGFME